MDDSAQTLRSPAQNNSVTEDRRLVEACLRGEEAAWETLIDKYKRLIISVPAKYGFSPEDRADIFQSVCLALFTGLPKLNQIDSLKAWLITVARNKCFQLMKGDRQHVELDALDEGISESLASAPSWILQEVEEEQKVREALQRLTPRCAELLKMLFFDQPPLAYAEIAEKLGLAKGSIGFIRGRCLKRLQKILTELEF